MPEQRTDDGDRPSSGGCAYRGGVRDLTDSEAARQEAARLLGTSSDRWDHVVGVAAVARAVVDGVLHVVPTALRSHHCWSLMTYWYRLPGDVLRTYSMGWPRESDVHL